MYSSVAEQLGASSEQVIPNSNRAAELIPYVDPYYLPEQLQFISWDFPNVAHTGVDIDYKMTGYDWFNRNLSWSVLSGPTGMTVDPKGILHWTPVAEGSESVTVGLRFDGGGEITKTFTITVDNARCIFIAPDGDDLIGDGSISAPYATLEKAAERITDTSSGYTVFHREGTYTKTDWEWLNDRILKSLSFQNWSPTDPILFRNFPSESVHYAVTKNGWRVYGSGAVFYNFEISGASTSETANIIVGKGSIAKLIDAHDADWSYTGNCTGIKHSAGSILDSCTAYNNYDRANLDRWNNSNFLFYSDHGDGEAFVIDCISDSLPPKQSHVGFKIKHAWTNKVHYHNCVDTGSKRPFSGVQNGASVRHSMFWSDDEVTVSHGSTDKETKDQYDVLQNNTDEGLLLDSNVIVYNGTEAGALSVSWWALQTTMQTTPFKAINNTIETTTSNAGNVFVSGRWTSTPLPDNWNIDFSNNTVYTPDTSESVILGGVKGSLFDLFDYGSGNSQAEQGTHIKTINGRTFQIANGLISESHTAEVPGDVDGDGRVELRDLILQLRILAGNQPSVIFTSGNDVGEDNKITLQESIYCLRHIAGLTSFKKNP